MLEREKLLRAGIGVGRFSIDTVLAPISCARQFRDFGRDYLQSKATGILMAPLPLILPFGDGFVAAVQSYGDLSTGITRFASSWAVVAILTRIFRLERKYDWQARAARDSMATNLQATGLDYY